VYSSRASLFLKGTGGRASRLLLCLIHVDGYSCFAGIGGFSHCRTTVKLYSSRRWTRANLTKYNIETRLKKKLKKIKKYRLPSKVCSSRACPFNTRRRALCCSRFHRTGSMDHRRVEWDRVCDQFCAPFTFVHESGTWLFFITAGVLIYHVRFFGNCPTTRLRSAPYTVPGSMYVLLMPYYGMLVVFISRAGRVIGTLERFLNTQDVLRLKKSIDEKKKNYGYVEKTRAYRQTGIIINIGTITGKNPTVICVFCRPLMTIMHHCERVGLPWKPSRCCLSETAYIICLFDPARDIASNETP